jgi:hypothetical protein
MSPARRSRLLPVLMAATAALALAVLARCQSFNFDYPGYDATTDAATDAGAPDAPECSAPEGGGRGYLSLTDAVKVCTLVFQCPLLADAITYSTALPIAIDESNFSACTNWLAGSVSLNHAGYAHQQALLQAVAAASSCELAYDVLPTRPSDAGEIPCPASNTTCSDGGNAILFCTANSGYQTFEIPCQAPVFPDGSSCVPYAGANALCELLDASCSPPGNCMNGQEEVCPFGRDPVRVDCTYHGEVCGPDGKCAAPGGDRPCAAGEQGVSCTPDLKAIRFCRLFLHTTFDCSQSGRACTSVGPSAYCGACDTCTPFDEKLNRCTGSTISLCVDGTPTPFDCASIQKNCIVGTSALGGHCGV